jgi:hypothetical protein
MPRNLKTDIERLYEIYNGNHSPIYTALQRLGWDLCDDDTISYLNEQLGRLDTHNEALKTCWLGEN